MHWIGLKVDWTFQNKEELQINELEDLDIETPQNKKEQKE